MSFNVDMTGLDKLRKNLDAVKETNSVSFTEMFSDSFMRKHTDFDSIQSLIDNSGFKVESEEDFAAIPEEEWDSYIKNRTRFSGWNQMQQIAGEEWLKKKLGL